MITTALPTEIEAFEAFVLLPENADRRFELVQGETIEMVSNDRSSEVAANILIAVGSFIKEKHLGRVTGADGGYQVGDDRYIPDAAYLSYARQAGPSDLAYNPIAPDLAVEVLSPTDSEKTTRMKLFNYLAAGTVVWLVDPLAKTIEVYTPGQPVKIYTEADTLDGSAVLPGFSLLLHEIFAA